MLERETFNFGIMTPDFTKPDVTGDELRFPYDTQEIRELWAKWKQMRYPKRFAMFGEQAMLNRMKGLTPEQCEECINLSIAGGWFVLYPEQVAKAPRGGKPPVKLVPLDNL